MRAEVLPVLLGILIWGSTAGAVVGDTVLGFWKTADGDAVFEMYRCGPQYCGRIAWLREPDYPPTARSNPGMPRMDLKNPDPALRRRHELGLTLLEGLRFDGGNAWWGQIYNPDDGRTYKCRITIDEEHPDRLTIRGYLGVPLLGGSQTWTRQEMNEKTGQGG